MLKINCFVWREYLVVRLQGVLITETSLVFDAALLELVNDLGINNLKIDLVDLDYIDEVGFDKIMFLLKKVKKCWQIRKI